MYVWHRGQDFVNVLLCDCTQSSSRRGFATLETAVRQTCATKLIIILSSCFGSWTPPQSSNSLVSFLFQLEPQPPFNYSKAFLHSTLLETSIETLVQLAGTRGYSYCTVNLHKATHIAQLPVLIQHIATTQQQDITCFNTLSIVIASKCDLRSHKKLFT